MIKRIIAIALTALLAAGLAACNPGGRQDGDGGAGGKAYAQQPFDGASVEGGLNPAVNSAGELVTASQAEGKPVTVTTWDANGKQKGSLATDVTDPASLLALGGKDEVYILAAPAGGDPVVHVLDASGKTARTIPLAGLEPAGMQAVEQASSGGKAAPAAKVQSMVIAMQALPDGGVVVSALGAGVVQFDSAGKQVRTYGGEGPAGYIALNEKNELLVYSTDAGAATLKTYDASSGKELSGVDVSGASAVQSLFYDRSGKRLLCMTDSDIRALSADGKAGDALAAFSDFSLIDGFRQLYGFAVDKAGTIYLTASNSDSGGDSGPSFSTGGSAGTFRMGGGVNEMIRLGLVDASSVAQRTTIRVAAINGSQLLNQVISAFQKAHPEYRIDLRVYNTQAVGMQQFVGPGVKVVSKQIDGSPADLTDAIQALNTDLMSGNGADIIVLDDLPWYKYVDKGILEDMEKLMADRQLDPSQYYTNIFVGCKSGGKLYGVPASFGYTLLTGKAAYMPDSASPTLTDFLAKAKALPAGVSAFGKQDPAQVFLSYIRFCYPGLVDAASHKARFDSPEFVQAMKDFRDLIGENANADEKQDPMAEQLNGTVAYNTASMSNPMDLAMQRAILGEDMKTANVPTFGGAGGTLFSASLMLGINAGSKEKDMAGEFVRTMLGADVQGSDQIEGYPVLKSAAQKKIDGMKTGAKLGNMRAVISMGGKQIEAKPLTDADYQSILDTLPALNTLQAADPNVLRILDEELPTFFSGQKSAEEVAGLIQNRVNTLLNE